jgi:tetrachlorobenzoquinone reductase
MATRGLAFARLETAVSDMSETPSIEVRVRTLRHEASGVISVDLVPYGHARLPAFTAGSHIDVHLPNGLSRSYSLMNPQSETDRYLIGVHLSPKSRGGSIYIHDELRVGRLLRISMPRNNFPVAETSIRSVFIAGGIGVTPFVSMLERLNVLGKQWLLYYCIRTREQAGFLDRLQCLASASGSQLELNFDQEPGGQLLDIGSILSSEPADTHVYCCGPAAMLNAFKTACQGRSSGRVHLEYFSSTRAPSVTGGFNVKLLRSGRTIFVPEGNTILEVLLAEGMDIPYSCQQGICAACETAVISGIPDHRDMILTPDQQASNKVMMICCSGSKTTELTLDR